MLTKVDAWPKQYAIGIPAASDITTSPAAIREHVARWQQVSAGEVVWRDVNYRASSEPIAMPSHWILERPSDWIRATADRQVVADYRLLEQLIGHGKPEFRDTLINNVRLLQDRSTQELQAALELAARLKPGEAQGRPLRLLAGHGIDTKFFERNRQLLVHLLDARFSGEVSEQGLHNFLGATPDGEHWLLLVPLQQGLLPFKVQQVRSLELSTLTQESIQASRVIVVENRQCWHQLPELPDTIAILGSGLDLDWLSADWMDNTDIAYWGDIDTWGLTMLARARQHRPELTALLMDQQTFDQCGQKNAVAEAVRAGDELPDELIDDEKELYRWLLSQEHGRLEQEYLPVELVHGVLRRWAECG